MTQPIVETIMDLVEAALGDITIANGYNVDVNSVYRQMTLAGTGRTSPVSYDVQLDLDDPQRNEELDIAAAVPIIGWDMPIQVDLVYRPDDDEETTAIKKALNIFWAAVQRALLADPYWSGYAHDTHTDAPSYDQDDDGVCYCTFMTTIQYRMKENDPYTLWTSLPGYTLILDGGYPGQEEYDLIIEGDGQ